MPLGYTCCTFCMTCVSVYTVPHKLGKTRWEWQRTKWQQESTVEWQQEKALSGSLLGGRGGKTMVRGKQVTWHDNMTCKQKKTLVSGSIWQWHQENGSEWQSIQWQQAQAQMMVCDSKQVQVSGTKSSIKETLLLAAPKDIFPLTLNKSSHWTVADLSIIITVMIIKSVLSIHNWGL